MAFCFPSFKLGLIPIETKFGQDLDNFLFCPEGVKMQNGSSRISCLCLLCPFLPISKTIKIVFMFFCPGLMSLMKVSVAILLSKGPWKDQEKAPNFHQERQNVWPKNKFATKIAAFLLSISKQICLGGRTGLAYFEQKSLKIRTTVVSFKFLTYTSQNRWVNEAGFTSLCVAHPSLQSICYPRLLCASILSREGGKCILIVKRGQHSFPPHKFCSRPFSPVVHEGYHRAGIIQWLDTVVKKKV